ncbi:MAG: division/cell wall cluster transcriptional repressor MraZ [Rhizobacter sp.]|nr:division/cell wall cluster transcriptional repressor MraZ [Chlorobiales bacterium]
MAGFIGKENHTIDDKGRLMIPVKFRKKFDPASGSEFFLMKMQEKSLELYERTAWEAVKKKLDGLSDFNPEERKLKMLIYGNLESVEIDKQGRIAVPKEFLEHTKITKDVTIIGADNKMIIWNPDLLREKLNEDEPQYETLTQRIL